MFDSGFGGLTVARAVIDLLPNEHLVYFGDTGRYPYGSKPQGDVAKYALEIADFLVAEGDIKMLVVACNTAAAAAFEELTERLSVPVVGVIEPGVRSLAQVTATGRVGVIGTVGTIDSGAYQHTLATIPNTEHVALTALACPGFVEFVERGETSGRQVEVLAKRLLAPMVDAAVDALLLGCTHYPFLARTIGDIMGPDVVLVSSADETAFDITRQLDELSLHRGTGGGAEHRFISSGDIAWFADLGRRLLGPELARAEAHEWA
jgi:glutamate racemase